MKIRSAVPDNGLLSHSFGGRKKTKKNKKQKQKTTAKHIRIRLLPEGGCVKRRKGNRGVGKEKYICN